MAMLGMESGSVTGKAVLIGIIVLMLLVPLAMLRAVVSERVSLRDQAYARVAEGWGGELTVGGPMVIVPTERTHKDTKVPGPVVYVLPSKLDADVDVKLEPKPRYVGIYGMPVYLSTVSLQGQFDLTAIKSRTDLRDVTVLWEQARVILPVSSVGSLREVQRAEVAAQSVKVSPAGPGIYRGIETKIDLSGMANATEMPFDFATVIAGSRSVTILPVGNVTTTNLRSDWPHPSFQGAFLPVEHKIEDRGFTARWQVLELNRNYGQVFLQGEVTDQMLEASSFGVGLYQPVDVYQRGERAVKYAVLFIALTFLTFFTWEQITRNRLHPLQYLLVGLALSMFYLLLIALSEHVAFVIAYVVAAIALVLLIGTYIAGALRSSYRGVVVGGAMSLVYGLLYMLVLSEDYSLLLGAIILFVALAAVMLATRRIDWYQLRSEETAETEA